MDQEVAKTLAELELKLRELERELMSIGRRAAEPLPPPPPPATPPEFQRAAHAPAPPPGRLVDEAVEPQAEQRYSMQAQETAFGEIPATKDERETIELGELVHFREEMQRTLQGLIDEYSRLLSLKPRSGA
ncbi:MAG TPA: hypothetical protein VFW38_01845 [Solirubrobacteraceae bacterium]|nr:hypothetical protein [Solirubrobacteraceae bacterium]